MSMSNTAARDEIRRLCQRMIQTLNDAETANNNKPPTIINGTPHHYWQPTKQSATARRTSMDLTRALAELRRP